MKYLHLTLPRLKTINFPGNETVTVAKMLGVIDAMPKGSAPLGHNAVRDV
jgi:hypothetical protein